MSGSALSERTAPLRVVLVDDEPLARLRLRGLLSECTSPQVEVVAEAANASEALDQVRLHPCDLLLLDIHMPGSDGLELAEYLQREAGGPAVVFVTAHAGHALRAFDLAAVDYLTKPVRRDRLQVALERVARQRQLSNDQEGSTGDEAVLLVQSLGRTVRVPVSEVLYLKAELKYVTVRTATASHLLDDTLSNLEQRLGDLFLRVHRNALVARRALRALERRVVPAGDDDTAEGWVVRVAPVDEWLQVSRRQVAAVKDAIAQGRL